LFGLTVITSHTAHATVALFIKIFGGIMCSYRRWRKVRKKLNAINGKLDVLDYKLNLVTDMLYQSLEQEFDMATDLSALTSAVAEDTAVDNSAIVLLNNLSAMLEDAKTDPIAIAEIAASLKDNAAALAAAVVANTPAAVEPPVEPPVE
jgi:hypothetical protein